MAGASGIGRSGVAWTSSGNKRGTWRLSGVENVTRRLNEEFMKMKIKGGAGLVLAAAHVLADAEKTPPLVPVDFGNLRNSTFVNPPKIDKKTQLVYVQLGYGTNYAAAVHEMMQSPSGKPINWSRPGSGPKFFEASLKRNSRRIIEIVTQSM